MSGAAYIVGAVRTPVGKKQGTLAAIHAADLGAHVIRALLERSGVNGGEIDDVIFGCLDQLGPQADEVKDQLTQMFTQTLDPALVSPAVAFLAHENCPVSGELYTAGGGQVSRWFIGRTKGYFNRGLTLEDVAEHFGEIRDEAGYSVMNDPAEEVGQVLTAVTGTTTTVK